MLARFLDTVESNSLFTKKDNLLLALSGGADSVALFHLLLDGGFSFSAAHVNYGLRGRESDKDEIFVKKLCEQHSIPLKVKKIDPDYWDLGMNIQNEARAIRYAFFEECSNNSLKVIAHHKDDNTETVLMNITRGAGLKGLIGMKMKSNGICRPLLPFEKSEISDYLKENKFAWREDASNLSDKYKRNRFRNDIIPLLKDENPSLNSAIDRLIENVSSAAIQMERSYEGFLSTLVKEEDNQIKISKGRPDQLDLHLYDFLFDYGFNRDQVISIITSLSKVGKAFNSNSHTLFIDRKDLILVEEKSNSDHDTAFMIFEHTSAMLNPLMLRFSINEDTNIITDKSCGQFDIDKLNFPLLLRKWRAGDRIHPLGMKGNKKVSDILIDEKVSRVDKENVYLLISNDEVIWIPGFVLSDKTKISSSTKKVFKVEMI